MKRYIFFLLAIPYLLFGEKPHSRVFLDGEFLRWKTTEPGLDFVIAGGSIKDLGTDQLFQFNDGKFINIEPGWDSGYRLKGGMHLPYSSWELGAAWTQFNARARRESTPPFRGFNVEGPSTLPNSYQAPLMGGSAGTGGGGYCGFSSAHWKLNYSVLDILLECPFIPVQSLKCIPFLGLKSAWIRQSMDVIYDFIVLPGIETVKNKMDFGGTGPFGGIATDWKWGGGFGFYGNFAAAIVLGKFDIRMDALGNLGGATGRVSLPYNIRRDYFRSRITCQWTLGLEWDRSFNCEQFRMRFNLGWEANTWFGMNKMFVEPQIPVHDGMYQKNEDLSFQGLTAGAKFDF